MDRYRRPALVAATYLGTFLASLDISIVNVALPTLQHSLATDLSGLQWVVNAYAIGLSAFMLSAGPLGDRFGHKRCWLLGVLLFCLGSALCALAQELSLLLAGRAVQGLAGALLIPGALPILSHAFPAPRQRAHVIGGWSAFSALALILGPLLGGLLLEQLGWQSIFLINLPIGLLALVLGCWGISERKHPQHAALDPLGQILCVLWLGALTYGLIASGEDGFGSPGALTSLLLSTLALLALIQVERRVQRPLVPLALFRLRPFAVANLASFILGFSCYSSLFFFSIFLQQIQGWSAADTGLRMLPQFVCTGCVSILFGQLHQRLPLPWLMVGGYGLVGLALSAMAGFDAHTPYWRVGSLFGLLGLGMGLAVPATGLLVMACAPAERAGIASASMNALRQTGMSVGIALLGSLMSARAVQVLSETAAAAGINGAAELAHQAVNEHRLPLHNPLFAELYGVAMTSGFRLAMALAGCASLLAMGVLLGTRRQSAHEPATEACR
ncbi:MFS transporter [Pseudomonas sp. LD120]|uniref:MFS transporter n=1 Tax=Pseudomonas sp. LD120 TaxID=485751 RepID=UPI0013570B1A|nr:MFS transporter [Pseudomonas sp. LD120]KAF0864551.1 DHA2 family efflux MFS transporter permease subunit [Pseudomonas sp. LD120]